MGRGRRTPAGRTAVTQGRARADEEAARAFGVCEGRIPGWMCAEGQRLKDGGATRLSYEPGGGRTGNLHRGAYDLLEMACWYAEGGAAANAGAALQQARLHQARHLALVEQALANPRRTAGRRLLEAHGLSGRQEHETRRAQLLASARQLLEAIDQMISRSGEPAAGLASENARTQRRDLARRDLIGSELAPAFGEGRLLFAQALLARLQRAEGRRHAAACTEQATRRQLEIAAALERAATVDQEHGEQPSRLWRDNLDALDQRVLADAIGVRRLGPLVPGAPTRRGCAHHEARWVIEVGPGADWPEGVGLICGGCDSRLAFVPGHRLPDDGRPLSHRDWRGQISGREDAYVQAERRVRALRGEAVPAVGTSIAQLREAEGVDARGLAEHRRAFQESSASSPSVAAPPPRSLADVLRSRR